MVAKKETNETNEKATKVKPTSNAKVRETKIISYDAEIENESDNNTNETRAAFDRNDLPFTAFNFNASKVNKNSLPYFFNALSETGNENFLVFVVRLVDLPTDEFFKPCQLYPQNFPPFTINVQSAQSFISQLQKFNGNSGGRFEIRVTDIDTGEIIDDAYLNNFVVPNPYVRETESDNNNMQMLEIIQQMQAKSDERFAQMLQAMKPQESEFDTLAKELLRKKLLEMDDKKPQEEFNPNKVIEQVFTSQLMIQQMSESIAAGFSKANQVDETPAWMKFLESNAGQAVIEKAGNTLNGLAMLAASKMQQSQAVQNPQPVTTPEQQQQLTPEQEQQLTVNMQNLIDDIIAELETENSLNADNETYQMLAAEYPAVLPMLIQACKLQPFENLVVMLESIVPDTFANLKAENGQYNEKGERLINVRLKEFYEFLKTQ